MERITDRPDGQADVPAEEAAPRQGARLPRQDEDDPGSSDPGRQAGTRSEAPFGLIRGRSPNPLRLEMLSHPQDFAAIQERGTSRSHPLLIVRVLRTELGTTRFAFSTGRRLGGAVVRNRVRRRLREALRVMAPSFRPGWDVLIIARPALVGADHDALVEAVGRLLRRSGVIGGPSTT
jgi:ribonuclease P protein component